MIGREPDAAARPADEKNIGVINKNCVLFTDCMGKISSTQVVSQKGFDVIVMYNLIEYSYNYSETSGSLWQYYRV